MVLYVYTNLMKYSFKRVDFIMWHACVMCFAFLIINIFFFLFRIQTFFNQLQPVLFKNVLLTKFSGRQRRGRLGNYYPNVPYGSEVSINSAGMNRKNQPSILENQKIFNCKKLLCFVPLLSKQCAKRRRFWRGAINVIIKTCLARKNKNSNCAEKNKAVV